MHIISKIFFYRLGVQNGNFEITKMWFGKKLKMADGLLGFLSALLSTRPGNSASTHLLGSWVQDPKVAAKKCDFRHFWNRDK